MYWYYYSNKGLGLAQFYSLPLISVPPSQQAMHLPKFRIIIQPKIAQQMFIHPTTEVIRNYAHLQQLQLIFMIRTSNLLLLIPPCQEIRQQGGN